MKLFLNETIHDGQIVSDSAYVVCGRFKPNNKIYSGWYVLFNFPFIKKLVTDYISPWTFEVEPTNCYLRMMFKCCKQKSCNKVQTFWTKVWTDV
jgi:hypothetical protein